MKLKDPCPLSKTPVLGYYSEWGIIDAKFSEKKVAEWLFMCRDVFINKWGGTIKKEYFSKVNLNEHRPATLELTIFWEPSKPINEEN
jgi:hypothetical protein